MTITVDPDWWKSMFDEVYLLTDARSVCDHALTQREVDLVVALLPILPHHRILDLCGGHGRHSHELQARGIAGCVLQDYSHVLLAHARREGEGASRRLDCVLSDARNTGFLSGTFDHVLIMGNSLGYLAEPNADREILMECHRLLRLSGWLLLDLTDGDYVRKRFAPRAWHEIGSDVLVCREREMREGAISVREVVLSKSMGLIRDRTYAIRFYDADAVRMLLSQAGFEDIRIISDFSPHAAEGDYGFMNSRMIVCGRKG
jgi:D-alanine-D-alanine ligase